MPLFFSILSTPTDKRNQNHFTKPLSSNPKSVRVLGLTATCRLSLETGSGAQVVVNAVGGCTKLPSGDGDGFVRVSADCDV